MKKIAVKILKRQHLRKPQHRRKLQRHLKPRRVGMESVIGNVRINKIPLVLNLIGLTPTFCGGFSWRVGWCARVGVCRCRRDLPKSPLCLPLDLRGRVREILRSAQDNTGGADPNDTGGVIIVMKLPKKE